MEVGGEEATGSDLALTVFDEIDTDGGGGLDTVELRAMIEKLTGEKLADNVLAAFMAAIDADGDGEITKSKLSESRRIF